MASSGIISVQIFLKVVSVGSGVEIGEHSDWMALSYINLVVIAFSPLFFNEGMLRAVAVVRMDTSNIISRFRLESYSVITSVLCLVISCWLNCNSHYQFHYACCTTFRTLRHNMPCYWCSGDCVSSGGYDKSMEHNRHVVHDIDVNSVRVRTKYISVYLYQGRS